MTNASSSMTHPADVFAEVFEDIKSARAFVARDNGFDSAQALRVALRRLRSALTLFRQLLPHEHDATLLTEARWLSAEVTRLRDLHLLWQDTLTPARVALPDNPALGALETRVLAAIEAERDSLRNTLEGDRVTALLAQASILSDLDRWKPNANSPEKVQQLCQEIMQQRLNQAQKHGESLKRLDPEARDSFRKSLRKLRATAEFSQAMFGSKKTKAFLKQLRKLLDSMTAARDASAVRQRLQSLMAEMEDGSSERHIAAELIKAKEAGVGLDNKRLQKMWRATTVLPLF